MASEPLLAPCSISCFTKAYCLDVNPSLLKTHGEDIRLVSDRVHTGKKTIINYRQTALIKNPSYALCVRYNQLGLKMETTCREANKPPRVFFFYLSYFSYLITTCIMRFLLLSDFDMLHPCKCSPIDPVTLIRIHCLSRATRHL